MNRIEIASLKGSLGLPDMEWDFGVDPHLFPLRLFQIFQEKYCIAKDTKGIHIDFFSMDDAVSEWVSKPLLSDEYSAWVCVRRAWETGMTFCCAIGEEGYIPILYPHMEIATVGLSVFLYEGNDEASVLPFIRIRGTEDAMMLIAASSIAEEIEGEMKKAGLSYTKRC